MTSPYLSYDPYASAKPKQRRAQSARIGAPQLASRGPQTPVKQMSRAESREMMRMLTTSTYKPQQTFQPMQLDSIQTMSDFLRQKLCAK